MTAESSPGTKSLGSFGETAAPACDGVRAGRMRMRVAVAVLVFGLVVAFVPGLVVGNRFLRALPFWFTTGWEPDEPTWLDACDDDGLYVGIPGAWPTRGTSAIDLVRRFPAWALVLASLMLVPVMFAWWRRADVGFARTAGIACAVAASASVVAFVMSMGLSHVAAGLWWTVPAGGALMAAAFVVAPTPRRRDE